MFKVAWMLMGGLAKKVIFALSGLPVRLLGLTHEPAKQSTCMDSRLLLMQSLT